MANLKKIIFLFYALFFLSFSSQDKNLNEDFDVFIKSFNVDFKFQKERVLFPLKVYYLDDDGKEKYYIVNAKQWKSEKIIDKSNTKIISEIFKKSDGSMAVKRSVFDTGSQVVYIFKKIKGKWFLIKIVDEST